MRPVKQQTGRPRYEGARRARRERVVRPAGTGAIEARRGRGGSLWRFTMSLAMLLTVALGAGLLTAGFTLPPPRPPQPPAAPAGTLDDIPGFRPESPAPADPSAGAEQLAGADRPNPVGADRRENPSEERAFPDALDPTLALDRTTSRGPARWLPGEVGPRTTRGPGLTATRAPAAPPTIPPAEDELTGAGLSTDTGARPSDSTGARPSASGTSRDSAASGEAIPRPGGPPMPPAGDPHGAVPGQQGATTNPDGTPTNPGPGAPPTLPVLDHSEPRRIGIPSLGVDAPIIGVGVDSDGGLEVPPLTTPMVAGWYRYGPSPGEAGNAVIVGHVDSRKSGPAVFFKLGLLKKGDLITVTRADGTVARFAVDGVRLFAKSEFPSQAVYGTGGQSRLRIVTCGGRFDRTARDYLDNVIAFATRVP